MSSVCLLSSSQAWFHHRSHWCLNLSWFSALPCERLRDYLHNDWYALLSSPPSSLLCSPHSSLLTPLSSPLLPSPSSPLLSSPLLSSPLFSSPLLSSPLFSSPLLSSLPSPLPLLAPPPHSSSLLMSIVHMAVSFGNQFMITGATRSLNLQNPQNQRMIFLSPLPRLFSLSSTTSPLMKQVSILCSQLWNHVTNDTSVVFHLWYVLRCYECDPIVVQYGHC